MIHQPPAGARDLLPLEVAQKRWITNRLQQVFQQWGYQRIITSTLEWLETLMAGGAIEHSTVIQLQDSSEGALGLRPELTASIARAAVTRMAGNTYPQRLYYRANVFRHPPMGHDGKQLEFYQTGVELLFAGGVLADCEILLLLADCCHRLELEQWNIVLGEAGLTRSLLAIFPDSLQKQVRHCIANLDRFTLENLPLSPELKEYALTLFDLRGEPKDVLQKVSQLELDESGKERINNLKSLIDLLRESSAQPLPIILDLSLIRTFDYYTGIVFELVGSTENSTPQILGQGGRYDQLLGLYHPQRESSPGIGFSLNLENLHQNLLSGSQLPQDPPSSDWLIVPKTSQGESAAFAYAQKLRESESSIRVELDLGGRSPEQIRDYAKSCRITQIAWIDDNGTPEIETL